MNEIKECNANGTTTTTENPQPRIQNTKVSVSVLCLPRHRHVLLILIGLNNNVPKKRKKKQSDRNGHESMNEHIFHFVSFHYVCNFVFGRPLWNRYFQGHIHERHSRIGPGQVFKSQESRVFGTYEAGPPSNAFAYDNWGLALIIYVNCFFSLCTSRTWFSNCKGIRFGCLVHVRPTCHSDAGTVFFFFFLLSYRRVAGASSTWFLSIV